MAGQTTGPICLNFFVDTHRRPEVLKAKQNSKNLFFKFFFQIFFPRVTPGPSVSLYKKQDIIIYICCL